MLLAHFCFCSLSLIAAHLFSFVQSQDCPSGTCICDTPYGKIDLSSLYKESSYTFSTNFDGYIYYYNLCGNSINYAQCDGDSAMCQETSSAVYFSTGSIYDEKIIVEGETSISIQYTGGQEGRKSIVKLTCDLSANDPVFSALGESIPLEYDFELRTKCACFDQCVSVGPTDPPVTRPGDDPGDGGGGDGGSGGVAAGEVGIVLMVLSIAGILAYFIVGGIVLHYKFEKKGTEIIPQKNFWFALPFLVKDGFIFTFAPVVNFIRSRIKRDGNYESI